MKIRQLNLVAALCSTLLTVPAALASLTLYEAVDIAIEQDTTRLQLDYQSQAIRQSAVAAGQWMDPKLKVGVGGLPVDSFSMNDDMMTNVSVGLMQTFSRGNTLALQETRGGIEADSMELAMDLRALELSRTITDLWIELYYLRQSHELLLTRQNLLERQHSEVIESYALGNNADAEAVLAVEISQGRIEQQLLANQQLQRVQLARLTEWLGSDLAAVDASHLPEWPTLQQMLQTPSRWTEQLLSHPSVRQLDKLIDLRANDVDIANEAYKPEFGVEMMYGYRQAEDMGGRQASDLVSVSLTMDLPLFTNKRQDKRLNAAQLNMVAGRAQRDTWLRQLHAEITRLEQETAITQQRIDTYQDHIIARSKTRLATVESSYESGFATFADVIQASDELLTVEMELARVKADHHQRLNQQAYFLNRYF
ncbi:TolC family protein [Photobacterium lutimaris]|uniref:Copper transporter n=1 Tax=Photobacterium lutimaris TaxID=388278 RepID=A0A2T3IZR1_9GAMM|nr:TolC family protein [Photobacterium lutimaris]PSU34175.1 copper transporter [Photobacterium lutimaris]TDR75753.1 outer membrane protein TolC [Photobacterium lutimaris]